MKNEKTNLLSITSEIAPKAIEYYKNYLNYYKNKINTIIELAFTNEEKEKIITNKIEEIKNNQNNMTLSKELYFMDLEVLKSQFKHFQNMQVLSPHNMRTESTGNHDFLSEIDIDKVFSSERPSEEEKSKLYNSISNFCDNIENENIEIKGDLERSLLKLMCSQKNAIKNIKDFDKEIFGVILTLKFQREALSFLHEHLRLIKNTISQSLAIKSEINQKAISTKQSLPNGYIEIKGRLLAQEIAYFFTFLTQETNGDKTPFLTEEELYQLLQYGFSAPNEPREKLISLNLSNKKTKAIIYYAMYRLYNAHSLNSHIKELYAKFLKFNFKEFSNVGLLTIQKSIKDLKPKKMNFDIEKYLLKKNN